MYMAPVVKARRPASSPLARRLVGAPVLVASATVMIPWLMVSGAIGAAVLGVRAIGQAPRALLQAIDYAGEVAIGR